jgi:hypothetical protein
MCFLSLGVHGGVRLVQRMCARLRVRRAQREAGVEDSRRFEPPNLGEAVRDAVGKCVQILPPLLQRPWKQRLLLEGRVRARKLVPNFCPTVGGCKAIPPKSALSPLARGISTRLPGDRELRRRKLLAMMARIRAWLRKLLGTGP